MGTTIFFSTHNMEEADGVSDRVAIMNQGKIAIIGTVPELKAKTGKTERHSRRRIHFLHGKQA